MEQEVIDRLRELREQLDRVANAIRHIEQASMVAENSANILSEFEGIASNLNKIEIAHRDALILLHRNVLGDLEQPIQGLLVEIDRKSNIVFQLTEETKGLHQSISAYIDLIKGVNFPDRLDKIDNQISSINIGIGNLQTTVNALLINIDNVHSCVEATKRNILRKVEVLEAKILNDNLNIKRNIKGNKILLIVTIGLIIVEFIYLLLK